MDILKRLKENVMGTEEQNRAAKAREDERQAKKDREQTKQMRKPTMDEQWYLDRARKNMATPVDEKASVLDAENNKAKTQRAYGKKMFEAQPEATRDYEAYKDAGFKKGGTVRSSASKRADGCAVKGKTRGKMV